MLPVIQRSFLRPSLSHSFRLLHVSAINEAARKGTREKARKKKVKVEIKKVGWIPEKLRFSKAAQTDKHIDDSWKAIPTDNVYPGRYYRWPLFTVKNAIECHKETHHPTMYDVPNAPLNVRIELNMQGEKKTRLVTNFQKLVKIDYPYEHGEERHVLVLAKDESQHKEALEAGAAMVGGAELIKSIHKGDVALKTYPYIIAHPNIMPELVSLRGLMRKNFPTPRAETLGTNIGEMVKKCLNGISYRANRDENQANFGLIETCIGTLDMPTEHLVSNFNAVLTSVNSVRPDREGKFITRVLFTSPPSQENLKIDPKDFPFADYDRSPDQVVKKGKKGKNQASESFEDEEEDVKEAAN